MEYALSLYFDEKSEAALNALIMLAAKSSGNSYMIDHKIPPHITISYFTTDNIDNVVELVGKSTDNFPRGHIHWGSLGAFPPSVLFATPVTNPYLLSLNQTATSILSRFVTFNDLYQPSLWIPHTSLTAKLTFAEMTNCFSALAGAFIPIDGTAIKLAVGSCEPYSDIEVFELY